MSEQEGIQPRIEFIEDLTTGVMCADVNYEGKPHFAMYWSASGKMTLLDPDDAEVVYREIGKWLSNGSNRKPEATHAADPN